MGEALVCDFGLSYACEYSCMKLGPPRLRAWRWSGCSSPRAGCGRLCGEDLVWALLQGMALTGGVFVAGAMVSGGKKEKKKKKKKKVNKGESLNLLSEADGDFLSKQVDRWLGTPLVELSGFACLEQGEAWADIGDNLTDIPEGEVVDFQHLPRPDRRHLPPPGQRLRGAR